MMKRWVQLLLATVIIMGANYAEAASAKNNSARPFKWFTNLEKAQEEAKRSSRAILLVYSGSDWCGFCQILEQKVLSTKAFKQYSRKKVVPLMADFPHKKKQTEQVQADAKAIRAKYPVSGFPTYYLLDADGKVLYKGSGCSREMTPKQFIAKLDAGFAEAEKAAASASATAANRENNGNGFNWYTNWEKAQAEAKRTARPILLVFSGSDWCGYCQILDKNILSTNAFREYAQANIVPLMADFPQKGQSAELQADARAIKEKYPVSGFPTIYLLDADGKEIFKQTGCSPQMTPEQFIQLIDQKLGDRKKAQGEVPRHDSGNATKTTANSNLCKWYTNLEEAKAEAKRSFRDIFLVFSGSDWCGFCQILDKKVLSTQEFADYANKNFVLVIADFPRKAQSEELKKDAEAIIRQYPANGFPTYYVLTADGKVLLKKSGCSPQITPAAFIEALKKALKK